MILDRQRVYIQYIKENPDTNMNNNNPQPPPLKKKNHKRLELNRLVVNSRHTRVTVQVIILFFFFLHIT